MSNLTQMIQKDKAWYAIEIMSRTVQRFTNAFFSAVPCEGIF